MADTTICSFEGLRPPVTRWLCRGWGVPTYSLLRSQKKGGAGLYCLYYLGGILPSTHTSTKRPSACVTSKPSISDYHVTYGHGGAWALFCLKVVGFFSDRVICIRPLVLSYTQHVIIAVNVAAVSRCVVSCCASLMILLLLSLRRQYIFYFAILPHQTPAHPHAPNTRPPLTRTTIISHLISVD